MALFGRPTAREQQRANAWGDWARQRNPVAIASLVLGLFSFIEAGVNLIFGIAGIVLGVIALRQLRTTSVSTNEPAARGHRLAWAGIVLSVLSLIVAALLYGRVIG
jgi:uncharacterized membrane protein